MISFIKEHWKLIIVKCTFHISFCNIICDTFSNIFLNRIFFCSINKKLICLWIPQWQRKYNLMSKLLKADAARFWMEAELRLLLTRYVLYCPLPYAFTINIIFLYKTIHEIFTCSPSSMFILFYTDVISLAAIVRQHRRKAIENLGYKIFTLLFQLFV